MRVCIGVAQVKDDCAEQMVLTYSDVSGSTCQYNAVRVPSTSRFVAK